MNKKLKISFMDFRLYNKAFTFVEILIALSIIALAIIPSLNVFRNFKRYTLNTEDIQVALRLAQEKVEQYKSKPYPELTDMIDKGNKNPESDTRVSNQTNSAGFKYTDEQYKKFKRKSTLSYLNNDPNMVLVTINVWWYDGVVAAGDQRYIILKALICKDLIM